MAFNIIAESSRRLDFEEIHKASVKTSLGFEIFPMPKLGINGGDAIGISVPLSNADEPTWMELKRVLKLLKSYFHCDVYDLYGGQKLGLFNINSFRKNLMA
ncbi:hypothetical protein [Pedobacter sp. SYSU D00535]|uniref:hypothetical protein n=1 Tax=Pedobacter sp. SYSU D00535 TaxID=2810308 RepID=UPI001A962B49|nr:hypothetical protein [Pedobacter sp. SYSU D00535]